MSNGTRFYRCLLCSGVVSKWDIEGDDHACPKCGTRKIRPSNLTLWEKFVQICKHPKFWAWDEDEDMVDPPGEKS